MVEQHFGLLGNCELEHSAMTLKPYLLSPTPKGRRKNSWQWQRKRRGARKKGRVLQPITREVRCLQQLWGPVGQTEL